MRLLSAIVRNYRIHRELTLDFDPKRTLIGGPNESGKSTLAEALHRALFLKAKGQTEVHRAMQSTRHAGQPEVELRFEADGGVIHLRKRFGGTGTTTLSRAGAPALQGEAAEAELARLLSVTTGATKGAALGQWSHLWVWQGSAGNDPCEPMSNQADRLLSRLQQQGGAVALQSDGDLRVSDAIASAYNALFTQAGKPRTGTVLDLAETSATEADAALARATDRRAQLARTVQEHDDATREIRRLSADLPVLTAQQKALQERGVRVAALRAREAVERTANVTATEGLQRLAAAEERIAELQRQVAKHLTDARPATDRARELSGEQSAAQQRAGQLDLAHAAALEATRRERQRRDGTLAACNRIEKAARRAGLAAQELQVRQHQAELAELRQQLAALPALDSARLKKLQDRERTANTADATWKSMAAGVEVLEADGPVAVGGESIARGEVRILTEETDITVGTTLKLRIRPGGGTSLVEARADARKAQDRLRQDLDALGLATVSEAQEVLVRRAALENRLETATRWLATLEADQLPQRLAEATEALAAAEAEWIRRTTTPPGVTPKGMPADEAAARSELITAEDALRVAETEEAARLAERDLAVRAATAAGEAVARHQNALDRQLREIDACHAQLRLLHELHGEDAIRAAALAAARTTVSDTEARWTQTQQSLATLQPELLEADVNRVARALDLTTRAQQETSTRLAVAVSELRMDGTEDPESDWALASARAAEAAEHLDRERIRASAIQQLHELIQAEQRALADRFTQPLADRINGYLRCLFGPAARAVVTLSDGKFAGLHLSRSDSPDGTIAFDSLSGGTREQVAAAARLAAAEILAADHGGSLPVVFDDAFAFSDPDRVQTLQRMLDLAAHRGLQVIVLTCTPSDYAALGAREFMLQSPAPTEGTAIGNV